MSVFVQTQTVPQCFNRIVELEGMPHGHGVQTHADTGNPQLLSFPYPLAHSCITVPISGATVIFLSNMFGESVLVNVYVLCAVRLELTETVIGLSRSGFTSSIPSVSFRS